MKQECFNPFQLYKYNYAIQRGVGNPVMFFVVPLGGKRKVPKQVIKEMETFLIQCARSQNKDLTNKQKVKQPQWSIKGVIRATQGNPRVEAKRFKKMMGL
ncbi:MAG: hypothetical protein AAB209_10020 [Bacteroidota bacterium]|jgi:hypothetical protein